MSHISHQRSLATELSTFHLENKTRAVLVINGLSLLCVLLPHCTTYTNYDDCMSTSVNPGVLLHIIFQHE